MRKRDGRATQTETVLTILEERGDAGVSAIELDRRFGIYRAGARIFELRQQGYRIETKTEHGKTAHYRLLGKFPEPIVAVGPLPQLWDEERSNA
jgi:biotin operon repressor